MQTSKVAMTESVNHSLDFVCSVYPSCADFGVSEGLVHTEMQTFLGAATGPFRELSATGSEARLVRLY
eukprot:s1074_g6.t1